MMLPAVAHAQHTVERFGNWVIVTENILIARTYAVDFKTHLDIFCSSGNSTESEMHVRVVWDTEDLYFAGSFPFVHQFDSGEPKQLPWIVFTDIGHTVLHGEIAVQFVQDAVRAHVVVIEGQLKQIDAVIFALDGLERAVSRVLGECRGDYLN